MKTIEELEALCQSLSDKCYDLNQRLLFMETRYIERQGAGPAETPKKSGGKDCNKCGKPITFLKNDNGKWDVLDTDGGLHFKSCPARAPR